MKVQQHGPRHVEVMGVRDGDSVSVYLSSGARLVIEHSDSAGDTIVVIPNRGVVTAYDANGEELANLSQRSVASG